MLIFVAALIVGIVTGSFWLFVATLLIGLAITPRRSRCK